MANERAMKALADIVATQKTVLAEQRKETEQREIEEYLQYEKNAVDVSCYFCTYF